MAVLHAEGFGLFKRGEIPNAAFASVQGYDTAYRTVADPVFPDRSGLGMNTKGTLDNTSNTITALQWNDLAYGNGLFIVAVSGGYLGVSTDGLSYDPVKLPTTNSINRVGYGNGKWIAVGNSGVAFQSTDGYTWTTLSLPLAVAKDLTLVKYVNTKWIIGGKDNTLLHSTDGASWTTATPVIPSNIPNYQYYTSYQWDTAVYGDGKYVLGGGYVDSAHGVLCTADFITWTPVVFPYYRPTTIIKHPSLGWFVYSYNNYHYKSATLDYGSFTQFTNATINTPQKGLFANGVFVLPVANGVMVSTDGQNFTNVTTNLLYPGISQAGNYFYMGIVNVGGEFTMIGAQGGIARSRDGSNWTRYGGIDTDSGMDVAPGYGGGQYIAMWRHANGGNPQYVYASPDGVKWTPKGQAVGLVAGASGYPRGQITYFNNAYWMGVEQVANMVYKSTDGVNWTQVTTTGTAGTYLQCLYAYDGKLWAAGYNFNIYSSVDGVNWTIAFNYGSGTIPSFRFVSEGNTIAVLGTNGYVRISTDKGVTWNYYAGTAISAGTGQRMALGGGLFMVGGPAGGLWTTRTPEVVSSWVKKTIPATGAVNDVAYADGVFYVTTEDGVNLMSVDGDTWYSLAPSARMYDASVVAQKAINVRNGMVILYGKLGIVNYTWGPGRVRKSLTDVTKRAILTGFSFYVPPSITPSASPFALLAKISMAGLGTVYLRNDFSIADSLTGVAPGSKRLTAGNTNYIEVSADPVANQLRAWINDTLVLDTTCTDPGANLTSLTIDGPTVVASELFVFGNWYVIDTTGTGAKTRLGSNTRILTQFPTDDVQSDFDNPNGGTHASVVGNPLGRATPKALYADTIGDTDLYSSSADVQTGVSKIHAVVLHSVAQSVASAPHSIAGVVKSNGTEGEGNTVVMDTAGKLVAGISTFYNDPGTGSEWTPAAVKAAAFGMRVKS